MKLWQRNLDDFIGKPLWVKVTDAYSFQVVYMKLIGVINPSKPQIKYETIPVGLVEHPEDKVGRVYFIKRTRGIMSKRMFDDTYRIAKGSIVCTDEDIEDMMQSGSGI